ncbi:hypothetical protein NQ176_g4513 [Zarea fungicola]|uniref:Uncharacterized protein n=1 Tax=Zarea fungicola TaxID=93591 RepID=A0ACC1NCZ8_9HYPO|nr:hypothetical protein NQ176_g4513 [Lecanicillium fungicola]
MIFCGPQGRQIYDKDGAGTHCFRFTNNDTFARQETPTGGFFREPLIGWNNWPSNDHQNMMLNKWKASVGPKLDDKVDGSLRAASGNGVPV